MERVSFDLASTPLREVNQFLHKQLQSSLEQFAGAGLFSPLAFVG